MKRSTFYIILGSAISMCILIAIIAFILFFAPSQKKSPQAPSIPLDQRVKSTKPQESFASIIIKDFTLKELEKGKDLEFTVNAKECNFIHTSDTIECTNVTCTLFDHKNMSASLKTEKALVNRTKKTIFLFGRVLGNMKELMMHGSDIYYDFALQTLTTDNPITFTHPDFNLRSNKSFIDLKNNRIKMTGGVVNEFIMHDKQQQP